jgi:hypothetical protein
VAITGDRLAGSQRAVGFGLVDHGLRDAVLDRPGGILTFEFGEYPHTRVRAERGDIDHRGVADQIEDRVVNGHGFLPRSEYLSNTIGILLVCQGF